MNSLAAIFTALLFWLSPAESDSRFTKYKVSASSDLATMTSGTYADVNNLSLSFKTTGRPVSIMFIGDGSTAGQIYGTKGSGLEVLGYFKVLRDSTVVSEQTMVIQANGNGANQIGIQVPVGALNTMDVPPAGTYTYKLQQKGAATYTIGVTYTKMLIYELP